MEKQNKQLEMQLGEIQHKLEEQNRTLGDFDAAKVLEWTKIVFVLSLILKNCFKIFFSIETFGCRKRRAAKTTRRGRKPGEPIEQT